MNLHLNSKTLARAGSRAVIASIYIFILAPILIVLVASVSTTNYLSFPPQGFTLRWFTQIEDLSDFIGAFQYSLLVGIGACALALMTGTWIAITLNRLDFRGKQLLSTFFLGPIIIPELAFAIGVLQYFSLVGALSGTLGLILAHSIICTPYVVRSVSATAVRLDITLEESARTLGAEPWMVIRDVTLPMLRPGLVAGAVMAFIISFDDVVTSVFLAAPGQTTLPALLFNQANETGLNSTIAAVCALLVLFMVVIMLILERVMGLEVLLKTAITTERELKP